ncbi:Serine/threonine-protein phosphatase 5 [Rhizoclosmatium sp. JEL0117]|nr:Serine/threonine-protein phosphatase 5 [Rhizoclosmatium sp. JEL0117]
MAEDLNKAATALYLKSDFEGAYKGYSKAMKADPTNTKYITNRAQASIRAVRPDLAIADSTMAISLDSNNPKGFVKRATAYQMKQQYELAIKDWNEALRLSPGDEKIASSQDECRRNMKDSKESAHSNEDDINHLPPDWMSMPSTITDPFSFPSLVRFDPSPTRDFLIDVRKNFEMGLHEFFHNHETLNSRSVYLLSNAMLREPRACPFSTEFIVSLKKAVTAFHAKYPQNDAALCLQGVFHLTDRVIDKAIDCMETAFKLNPYVEYAVILSRLYLNIDQNQESVSWANRALKLDPTSMEAYCICGYAYFGLEKWKRSKAAFQNYLKHSSKEASKRAAVFYQLSAIFSAEGNFDDMCACFYLGTEAEKDCFPLYEFGAIEARDDLALIVKVLELGDVHLQIETLQQSNRGFEVIMDACFVCGLSDATMKVCGQCGNVRYCSRICQSKHWKSGHKLECKKV